MTYTISYFVYLAIATALAQGSEYEIFDKPQTEQGNTHDIQVVQNEHLFTAGNDSSGTAAITFASRLNSSGAPTINRFINHSFPHSCTSHPTRCRELMNISYHKNGTNLTRVIFYVPLMGPNSAAALGLMEFWHDGETISRNITTRIISVGGQCDPVSVVRVPRRGVYLICASDEGSGSLRLCQVINRDNVSTARLSCTAPHSLNQLQPRLLANLSLLSNFIVDTSDLYFVYSSVLYHMTLDGIIEGISYFQTFHCRYIHLASVNSSHLIGHCYEHDRVGAFYFYLYTHQYIPISQGDVTIANYHCPDPQQLVTINVSSQSPITRASYQDAYGGVDRGRFNLNASQVIFAKCYNSRNETHFIYQDSESGIFIKPNISIDLLSRLVWVSDLHCTDNQPCKQPLIFSDRYLILTYNMDEHRLGMAVFDLYEDLNRIMTSVSDSATQIAFFSKFTKHVLVPINETQTTDIPPEKIIHEHVGIIIAVCVAIFLVGVIFLVVVVVVCLIRRRCCKKGEGRRRCHRQYDPVARNEEMNLKDTRRAHDHETGEPQRIRLLSKEESLSPTPPPPEETITNAQETPDTNTVPPEHEPCVLANSDTVLSQSSEGNVSLGQGINALPKTLASEDLPHPRNQCSMSQDSIPASLQCTQPSIRTHGHIAGCEPALLQHMDPTVPRFPPSTSTVYTATQYERPRPGFDRQSSLPNPPRPCTLIPRQVPQQRSDESPQLHRSTCNTNATTSNTTIHSLTPDNDLEYQRQQLQQQVQQQRPPHQIQPTTSRMNSSDSNSSAHSQTSAMSTHHVPPVPVHLSHSLPPQFPLEHAYNHASHPHTVNAATSHQHQHGPQNFQRLASRESASSMTSLTPESRPESGRQTGSMLVTGTNNYH